MKRLSDNSFIWQSMNLGWSLSLTYFMKCSSWWGSQCSTRHDSCYIYKNFINMQALGPVSLSKTADYHIRLTPTMRMTLPSVTVVVKLYRWLYHIHICPIAPQNHPGENISLLQFNPLKINWTGSIMCCCLNQESCNTHW